MNHSLIEQSFQDHLKDKHPNNNVVHQKDTNKDRSCTPENENRSDYKVEDFHFHYRCASFQSLHCHSRRQHLILVPKSEM